MNGQRVKAVYLIETACELEHTAEVLAGEQSTGTFLTIPGETEDIKRRHRARVERVTPLDVSDVPALPGAKTPTNGGGGYRRGLVEVTFPYENIGPSIPNLLATVAGNLYELEELSGIRLVDLELPAAFLEKYRGSQFGVAGTRKLLDVYGRPVIGTIVKPNIGLDAEGLRSVVRELAMGGIDFIKDDEVNGDPPFFPLKERIRAVMEEIERAADATGKKTMYAFNITGDIDELRRNHDEVAAAGGNCVMVSVNSIGMAGLAYLRSFSEVPIHGHRNQWGMFTRHPFLGMAFTVYQKLCRLAGVDHLHTNGLNNNWMSWRWMVRRSPLRPPMNGWRNRAMRC